MIFFKQNLIKIYSKTYQIALIISIFFVAYVPIPPKMCAADVIMSFKKYLLVIQNYFKI